MAERAGSSSSSPLDAYPSHPPPSSDHRRRRRFDEIMRAYEVLGDDRTRLLYHRYGFDDVDGYDDAIRSLLLGAGSGLGGGGFPPSSTTTMPSPVHDDDDDYDDDDERESRRRLRRSRLLELMGHPPETDDRDASTTAIGVISSMAMVERIRPMVEGTIARDAFP